MYTTSNLVYWSYDLSHDLILELFVLHLIDIIINRHALFLSPSHIFTIVYTSVSGDQLHL